MGRIKSYQTLVGKLRPTAQKIRRSDFRLVCEIRNRSANLKDRTVASLKDQAASLRKSITDGQDVLERRTIVESFALTAEALRRTTGKVYYDVQLLGGLVLATGSIAEMQTGEGKTITCGLPAVLYGLTGRGVHVATTNAYLAGRDYEELAAVFDQLGVSSGLISCDQDPDKKRNAYLCDVTYGTGYEFGFDFLRDQLAIRKHPKLPLGTRFLSRLRGMDTVELGLTQRDLHFAIIDEADSVLIDEAATPLILSGGSGKRPSREVYQHAMLTADSLEERHYQIDPVKKSVKLSDEGWRIVHSKLIGNIQNLLARPWSTYVEQSLHAGIHLIRDRDYVVQNDEVMIVDQNTGRIHDERKWRSGLHQSAEMREGVLLTDEREIEARITRQRYFRFYDSVCGMTGTAEGNETELLEFYSLPVVQIPRNKPSGRVLQSARYFSDQAPKFHAIAREIVSRRDAGQPVLVGTRTITQSKQLAALLEEKSVPHAILNGTQDDAESAIIARAGLTGSVTIATNMAGRGTDIRLDNAARTAGGLHVVVVEHHDSKRVDRQLIGRSARQADPGSCRFFVAADDELIARYDESLGAKMRQCAGAGGECKRGFDKEISRLQDRIEKMNFAQRQKMVVHDNWVETVQKSVA